MDWEKFRITRTRAKNRSRTQNLPDLWTREVSRDSLQWKQSSHVIARINARKTRLNDPESKKMRTLELGIGEEREEQNHRNKNTQQPWIPEGTLTLRGELPTNNHHKVWLSHKNLETLARNCKMRGKEEEGGCPLYIVHLPLSQTTPRYMTQTNITLRLISFGSG